MPSWLPSTETPELPACVSGGLMAVTLGGALGDPTLTLSPTPCLPKELFAWNISHTPAHFSLSNISDQRNHFPLWNVPELTVLTIVTISFLVTGTDQHVQ